MITSVCIEEAHPSMSQCGAHELGHHQSIVMWMLDYLQVFIRECDHRLPEFIKPSSSTPPHLQTLRLCLDQNGGLGHVPIILYYPKRDANFNVNEKLINQLKDSLSETLTLFYPLAGRVKDDGLSIDCNDEGILFSTTRVNCDMAELLTAQPPNLLSLPRLLPVYVILDPRDKAVQVAIQLNIFACGGFVISGCFMRVMLWYI
ncbi:acetyl-CoA-benzylalcohol acetyltransferase-like [Camellia sinensis]|uniref:acetyl-CoA-benzylalcohol acetyltransferase-like n=1 Tax=Camellia sinensis TaxID=4442 RepID=UPI0010359E66|nr:acetyl-CoA-benzylalcohol acetyltransferase-like [Camellia sinensis]